MIVRRLARVLVGAFLFAPAALSAATAVSPPASEAERWLRHEAAGASVRLSISHSPERGSFASTISVTIIPKLGGGPGAGSRTDAKALPTRRAAVLIRSRPKEK